VGQGTRDVAAGENRDERQETWERGVATGKMFSLLK